MQISNKIRVSTVTPVYAGSKYLAELVSAVEAVKDSWAQDANCPLELCEAIFVVDAAIDDSEAKLRELSQTRSWLNCITLSRNFGQHPATIAGVLYTSGDWVITLDEDLQHHPKHFLELLRPAVTKSSDIVYANPEAAVHQSALRDLGSRLYKGMLAKITDNKHIKDFNSYRLMRGSVARAAASVCSHETYFDIALGWFTSRIITLKLPLTDQRYIEQGKSGYNLRKLISHARRLVVSSQTKLLRAGSFVGLFALVLSLIFAARTLYDKFVAPEQIGVQGWASLFLSILFFGGLISLLLGVVLEFLTNILLHNQGKPTFFVVDRSSDVSCRQYFESSPSASTAG